MEIVIKFVDILIHLDKYLNLIIQDYGIWTYTILFTIIFCETGLVVTPFLPGDSLLFAAGTFSALGSLNAVLLFIILTSAAILGDTVNYSIGRFVSPRILETGNIRFIKKEHLDRTHEFFERYGGKTIIIARFVPIVRTFAPFVAGIASMTYWRFALYNITGAVIWVASFLLAGYFFGNIPAVKNNFSIVIFAIIFVSILPGIFSYLGERKKLKK